MSLFPLLLLQSVQLLPVSHTVTSVGSVSLCPLLSSRVCLLLVSTCHCTMCPMSLSTSQCTECWCCDTMSRDVFYSLPIACHCLTLYSLCSLSLPNTVSSLNSVSFCPVLSSAICPLPLSTSHCTFCQPSLST